MLTSKQYHDLLKAKLRRFSGSQEEWKRFLKTSARMYKYGFKDSVSIFAQKPNATACAEIKTWKKATNRRVIRTSEAIGLVYSTDNVNVTSIRYVLYSQDKRAVENTVFLANRRYLRRTCVQ